MHQCYLLHLGALTYIQMLVNIKHLLKSMLETLRTTMDSKVSQIDLYDVSVRFLARFT